MFRSGERVNPQTYTQRNDQLLTVNTDYAVGFDQQIHLHETIKKHAQLLTMSTTSQPCFIGIDFAITANHALSIRLPGEEPSSVELPPLPSVIDRWLEAFCNNHQDLDILVALEAGSTALLKILVRHPRLVIHPVNPSKIAAWRNSFTVGGAKSDPADARLIRRYLEERHDTLDPHQPNDGLSARIARLSLDRRTLVDERSSIGNAFRDALRRYCPGLVAAFGKGPLPIALVRLVRDNPTLQDLKARRLTTLLKRLKRGRRTTEAIEAIHQAIQETPADLDEGTDSLKAATLARLYLHYTDEIKRYDDELKDLVARHPDRALVESIPGMGPALGARILGLLGTDRSRWKSAEEFACATGIAPVTLKTGSSAPITRKRYACNRHDRNTLHEFARCSTKYCDWAGAYQAAKKAAGKKANTIFRALALKWVRVIFACWKHHEIYDPTRIKSPYKPAPADAAAAGT